MPPVSLVTPSPADEGEPSDEQPPEQPPVEEEKTQEEIEEEEIRQIEEDFEKYENADVNEEGHKLQE